MINLRRIVGKYYLGHCKEGGIKMYDYGNYYDYSTSYDTVATTTTGIIAYMGIISVVSLVICVITIMGPTYKEYEVVSR